MGYAIPMIRYVSGSIIHRHIFPCSSSPFAQKAPAGQAGPNDPSVAAGSSGSVVLIFSVWVALFIFRDGILRNEIVRMFFNPLAGHVRMHVKT